MVNGIGFFVILACVFGSFIMSGGKMEIIFEALPHELMAIGGAAIGAFIVGNSIATAKKAGKGLLRAFKGSRWKDSDYRDLLTLMFGLLSTFKKAGATGIEPHLDSPKESALFSRYPRILADHHLVDFICDYLRMMTVNFEDPNQIEAAMDADIEKHHHEELAPQHALQIMADGLPAIGIVAAVLGVIKTMGSIDQATQQNAAMVEETSAAARNLSTEVENLAGQASQFRTTADHGGGRPARAPAAKPVSFSPAKPRRKAEPAPAVTHGAGGADDWNAF